MLNILQKNNLCNIVAVVTRYFGGVLLGTGGLVRSYSDSLFKAIEQSEKTEICMGEEYEVELEYSNLENFRHYCKINNVFIDKLEYAENICCKIQLEEKKKQKLIEDFETKKINLINLKFFRKKIIEIYKLK